MTLDEEMTARGRLVTEYGDVKRHLATMRAEVSRIAAILKHSRIGAGQRFVSSFGDNIGAEIETVVSDEKLRQSKFGYWE